MTVTVTTSAITLTRLLFLLLSMNEWHHGMIWCCLPVLLIGKEYVDSHIFLSTYFIRCQQLPSNWWHFLLVALKEMSSVKQVTFPLNNASRFPMPSLSWIWQGSRWVDGVGLVQGVPGGWNRLNRSHGFYCRCHFLRWYFVKFSHDLCWTRRRGFSYFPHLLS